MNLKYIVIISILLISITGCGIIERKVILTGSGIIISTVAAIYKYKGDKEKTKAINNFRDEIRSDLKIIKKELNIQNGNR